MRRPQLVAILLAFLIFPATIAEAAPRWERKLHRLVRAPSLSIQVSSGDRVLLARRAERLRIPASNEKLVLSMALLDRIGGSTRIPTQALAGPKRPPLVDPGAPDIRNGVLYSHLWVVGRGDPTLSGPRSDYGDDLTVRPTRLAALARAIKRAGVRKVDGRVIGVRSYFAHDWDAPGWKPSFPYEQVALPSALSLDGNVKRWRHIRNPEIRVAKTLTNKLEEIGVWVKGKPNASRRPEGLVRVAQVRSRPLAKVIGHMNRVSSNFFAEVLGKSLAVATGSRPGTIAGGAKALRRWVRARGVPMKAHDGSGLSHSNRISAQGIVKLLRLAEDEPWGEALFRSLPKGGWGTLENRFHDVRLRAKTGTLEGVSGLSGWVWLRRSEAWARFSILVNGAPTWEAKAAENQIVKIVSRHL